MLWKISVAFVLVSTSNGFVLPRSKQYRTSREECVVLATVSDSNDVKKSNNLPPGRRTPRFVSFLFDDSLRLLNPKTMGSYQIKRSEQFGDIFKTNIFTKPTVIVASEETLTLLGKEEARTRASKGTEAFFPPHHQSLFGPNSLLVQSGQKHERLRRLIQPSLAPNVMSTLYQPIVDQGVDDFLQSLKSVPTDEDDNFELVPLLRSFFISIALQILLGKASEVPPGLPEDLRIWSKGLLSPPLTYIPWSTSAKAVRARKRIVDTMAPLLQKERVAAKNDKVGSGSSLLSRLVTSVDEETGQQLSDEDILDNVLTIIFAGSDTTASAATSMWMTLSMYPDLKRYLQNNPEDIGRFVAMILQEYPPAPLSMRLVKEPLSVKGYDIPEGWLVIYGFAGALGSKSKSIGAPTRWDSFENEKNASTNLSTSGSVAFGVGPRMCPGRYLASLELMILCQKLVSGKINWNIADNQDFRQEYNPGFFPKDGLKIKLVEVKEG